jgi:predicted RNase H-like HicB family nuclease
MKDYYFKVIIEPAEEGGFTAYVPKLPGCVSEGETYEETLKNIKEATELYLEVAREREHKIIQDDTHIAEMCITI